MISKSKSRTTVLGAERFRYKISSKPVSKGIYELNITIQNEASNASKLLVTGIMDRDHRVIPHDSIFSPTILRMDIDGFIEEAIANGWDSAKKGEDFILALSSGWYSRHGRAYGCVNKFKEQAE